MSVAPLMMASPSIGMEECDDDWADNEENKPLATLCCAMIDEGTPMDFFH